MDRRTNAPLAAALIVIVTLGSGGPAIAQSPSLTADDAYALATQAYLYAYPLVLMEQTRQAQNRPLNQFQHAPAYPTPQNRLVVRPNVDTLYSTAWLDLSKEPVVMTVPDTGTRYYLIQMMDAWTETFAVPGTRTTGNKAGRFAIVGPGWKGTLPPELTPINAPTNTVWIIGRIQTNGVDDYPNVRALQRGFVLSPLSGAVSPTSAPAGGVGPAATLTPPQRVAQYDATTFFAAFTKAVTANRPHVEDAAFVARIKALGIAPGSPFEPSRLSSEAKSAVERAAMDAQKLLSRADAPTRAGWRVFGTAVGRYGTAYRERAAVARGGLGALPPEDAVYTSTANDADGKPLTGGGKYLIHFPKAAIPPVNAFWSLTLYDADGYFAPNAINRYALGDRDRMAFNADGSLDVYLQAGRPPEAQVANWLPAPAGEFNLSLRLYWPKPETVSGSWTPPAVRRLP
jgi:hypothetical protein